MGSAQGLMGRGAGNNWQWKRYSPSSGVLVRRRFRRSRRSPAQALTASGFSRPGRHAHRFGVPAAARADREHDDAARSLSLRGALLLSSLAGPFRKSGPADRPLQEPARDLMGSRGGSTPTSSMSSNQWPARAALVAR